MKYKIITAIIKFLVSINTKNLNTGDEYNHCFNNCMDLYAQYDHTKISKGALRNVLQESGIRATILNVAYGKQILIFPNHTWELYNPEDYKQIAGYLVKKQK